MTSGSIAIGVGDGLAALLASSLRLTFVTFGKGRSISWDAAFTQCVRLTALLICGKASEWIGSAVRMDWDSFVVICEP